MNGFLPRPLSSSAANRAPLRGAVAFGPLRRGSRAESHIRTALNVPPVPARHNPSFHATCASLRLSHARELQR